AIIGILASIAVPSFIRNARKAKSSEAIVQLNKIYLASKSYILESYSGAGSSAVLGVQFSDTETITPVANCCTFTGEKRVANAAEWQTPTWRVLLFSVDDPHYYRYAYTSTGAAAPGPGSNFHAQAYGDLNCNGSYSTFELYGIWSNVDNDVHGSGGFFMD